MAIKDEARRIQVLEREIDVTHRMIGDAPITRERAKELELARDGTEIFMVLNVLKSVRIHNAIGGCLGFLLDCAYNHRDVFRRCMRDRVHKDGLVGISILEVFRRQSE